MGGFLKATLLQSAKPIRIFDNRKAVAYLPVEYIPPYYSVRVPGFTRDWVEQRLNWLRAPAAFFGSRGAAVASGEHCA